LIHRWAPFLVVALAATGLCVWAGRLGPSEVMTPAEGQLSLVLLSTGLWISSLMALLLLPKGLSFRYGAVAIMALAAVCRLGLVHLQVTVRLTVVLIDLATLSVVLLLLQDRRLDPRWALLYALNPVVLYTAAVQGYLAIVPALLITGSVWLYRKRHWPAMFFLLGLTVAGFLELLAWPLFLHRENLRFAWIAPVAALIRVRALPALLTDGLADANKPVQADGPLCWLLHRLEIGHAAVICLALLVPLCLICCWLNHPQRLGSRAGDPVNGLLAVLGAALLLSPSLQIECLVTIIALLAVRPLLSWLVLSGTMALTLVIAGSGQPSGSLWVTPAVWLVPLLLLLRELHLAACRLRSGGPWPEPSTISVVIPVRNEAERLGSCLDAISRSSCVCEVIVVDGGSNDSPRQVAESSGAKVIEHVAPVSDGGGRGGQINAGCRQAVGDLVAIVHADTRLEPGSLDRALTAMAADPDAAGATLGGRLDAPGIKLRLLELFNDLRASLLGISFGDQVQLFRRQPVMERKLYPAIPLMEDVELSLRLHRLGRVLFLWQQALVSVRRWQSGSRWKTLQVNSLVAEYLLRRLSGSADTTAMYHRYYESSPRPENNHHS
jgi:hypothetical protein